MRKAEIYFKDHLAGILTETESGYEFRYNKEYSSVGSYETMICI